ncbi:threonine ammonia-lyase [Stappia stellulata]|uniref:threonine ammonia-lyase n=1 Tax=Stappia stellulata TaxID=71235 RepID=UPI000414D023|nr:threonine ammonia-lyase [Stappia stellulata]
MSVSLDSIRAAAQLISGAVMRTPCLPAPKLSRLTGADVWVKYENLQVTNAFKERGALVKLSALSPDERRRGVIAMSAGNHAQAVAYHAGRLGIPATIVMPKPTPFVKVAATRGYGARVVLAGEMLADAHAEAERIAEAEGLVWVHPYDDEAIICGQGTIALEMLEDHPGLECLVVPVGGGGLISGMATAAKALRPGIEVIGVEAALYPSMKGALDGETVQCGGATLAEGIAVKNVGELTLEIVRESVDDILLVDEAAIEQAVNAYLTQQKTMAEGAGAAGLAALLSHRERFAGRSVGLVMCGGNIDPRLLSSIMVRGLAHEGRLLSIRITTPDRPGVLGDISTLIGSLGGNILEVSHHRLFLNVPAKGTTLDVTMETHDRTHAQEILTALEGHDFSVRMLDLGESRL